MNKFLKLAAVAVVALSATPAFADLIIVVPPGGWHFDLGGGDKGPSRGQADVTCRFHGTDLLIGNFGNGNLDPGVRVSWSSPALGDRGQVTVPRTLTPGEELRVADALVTAAPARTRCTVSL